MGDFREKKRIFLNESAFTPLFHIVCVITIKIKKMSLNDNKNNNIN